MLKLNRNSWWMWLPVLLLAVPHCLAAQSQPAAQPQFVPATATTSPRASAALRHSAPSTVPSSDDCVVHLKLTLKDAAHPGRSLHTFDTEDAGAAQRLHRRSGMEPVQYRPHQRFLTIARVLPFLPTGESCFEPHAVGRAPPAV